MINKKESSDELKSDFEVAVSFLDSILDRTNSLAQHIDNQIQILIGISSAIFIFSAGRLYGEGGKIELPLLVLAIFSIVSTISGLFAVHPPLSMREKGRIESLKSLMYNKRIISFPSSSEYGEELLKTIKNPEEIVKQYATEIYTLSKYYYIPKRKLFHLTRDIFFLGFIISFLVLILNFLKF